MCSTPGEDSPNAASGLHTQQNAWFFFGALTLGRRASVPLVASEGAADIAGCANPNASTRNPGRAFAERDIPTTRETGRDSGPTLADKDGEKDKRMGGRRDWGGVGRWGGWLGSLDAQDGTGVDGGAVCHWVGGLVGGREWMEAPIIASIAALAAVQSPSSYAGGDGERGALLWAASGSWP